MLATEAGVIPQLEEQQQEIEARCRRFSVRRLEVFGSAATGSFGPESDFDFLVEFGPSENAFDQYFGLREALEDLLGSPVDLVVDRALKNPYVRASVDRQRTLVYAA